MDAFKGFILNNYSNEQLRKDIAEMEKKSGPFWTKFFSA